MYGFFLLVAITGLTGIWASLLAQLVKDPPEMQETLVWFLGWEDLLERDRLLTPVFLGCGSAGKESACNMGDLGLIPGLGRYPGEVKGYPLQYSGLENSMAFTVAKSWTQLSDFHFHFHWHLGHKSHRRKAANCHTQNANSAQTEICWLRSSAKVSVTVDRNHCVCVLFPLWFFSNFIVLI